VKAFSSILKASSVVSLQLIVSDGIIILYFPKALGIRTAGFLVSLVNEMKALESLLCQFS